MVSCAKCDCMPAPAGAGQGKDARVLVYAPAPPAMGKVHAAARAVGYAADSVEEYVVVLHGPAGGWVGLLHALESGTIFAHEALLRAQADDGSIIAGGQIIEAGRRMGALHVLDQHGRRSAIEGAHALGMKSLLFINFFPTVVYDPVHCLRTTREAMRETGLQPDQIVFEVVESEDIADRGHLLNILTRYRAEGFRVALDDLGSGYASLNLLADLRPDFVKLDMELVRGAASDPLRRGLVQAIVRAARDEGIRVIAEGVETLEVAELLAEIGVSLLQGYYFGRPSPRLGDVSATVPLARGAAAAASIGHAANGHAANGQVMALNGHAPLR